MPARFRVSAVPCAALLCFAACAQSHRTGAGEGGPARDGGGRDGMVDAGPCLPCPAPPPGCTFADACHCGGLTCAGTSDGGPGTCECPQPAGCATHLSAAGMCSCGYLDCACTRLQCDEVSCGGGSSRFPTFNRTCSSVDECVMVDHHTDCCGSIRAMGIARSEVDWFDTNEQACDAMLPRCGCDSNQVTADDGTVGNGTTPTLLCIDGTCQTTFGI